MLGPIAATCPVCGSHDVIYSCAPHCCFNHVCGDCRASWQHRTRPATETQVPAPPDAGTEYDTSNPSAPCAGCGQLVFQIERSAMLWCGICRRVLELECTEVAPWAP